jgi:hypothetical protein
MLRLDAQVLLHHRRVVDKVLSFQGSAIIADNPMPEGRMTK